jgi:fused signal recognition particle receptor
MALKGWLGRLRGREAEPPPVSSPPGQLPEPARPAPLADLPATPTTILSGGVPLSAPSPLPRPAVEAPPAAPPPPPALDPPAPSRADEALREALATTEPEEEPEPAAKSGWFSRLKAGLARSTQKLTESVTTLFRNRRLDEAALEELEETLIAADLGVAAARRIVEGFRATRFGREVTDEEVKAALADEIARILEPVAMPMPVDPARRPHVVLVVGVNGTGKTTTIAKLGQHYRAEGHAVMFAAGDTFRAAAVEQLQIWGERTGCPVIAPAKPGADAAGLAYDALAAAREQGAGILLVDTAGRLHNKAALMEELRKVVRVMRRLDPTAPHSVLLVLDATTGQNAVQQAKVFKEMVEVTGIAVTKLDGSAKGGVVVALAQEFGIPLHMVGVGEKAADLRPFAARDFARGLVGLD